MDLVPVALLGSLVYSVINFLKYAKAGDGAAVTQALVWVGGIIAVFLAAETSFAHEIDTVVSLADANVADKVFLGMMASSLFSVVNDVKKAVDNTDSAATPDLF